MIGNNKLQLNEATMIKIVQEWIDRTVTLTPQPKVTAVKHVSGGYNTDCFDVSLLTEEEGEPSSRL